MLDEVNYMPRSIVSIDLKQYRIDTTRDEIWSSQSDLSRDVDLSFRGLPFVFAFVPQVHLVELEGHPAGVKSKPSQAW